MLKCIECHEKEEKVRQLCWACYKRQQRAAITETCVRMGCNRKREVGSKRCGSHTNKERKGRARRNEQIARDQYERESAQHLRRCRAGKLYDNDGRPIDEVELQRYGFIPHASGEHVSKDDDEARGGLEHG